MTGLAFVTCVQRQADAAAARLLADSLRAFGGVPGRAPLLVFADDDVGDVGGSLEDADVELLSLSVPPPLRDLPFGAAVAACEAAEARSTVDTLVCVDPHVLFCRPPRLLDLGDDADVAVRPVHMHNVGSPVSAPPNAYWRRVYAATGTADDGRAAAARAVESFADGVRLRAYFNSHVLAVRRRLGLLRRRREVVEALAADSAFLAGPCADTPHRVFLFQAAFAAVVAETVDPSLMRILPPTYGYPYNLHAEVPRERRASALEDLVCFVWEGRDLEPGRITDIEVGGRLRRWLAERAPARPL